MKPPDAPTASPGLDHHGRSVLPHRDPTFDAVVRLLQEDAALADWKLVGPAPDAATDRSAPLEVHLAPDVARAVLRHLTLIASPRSSRTGRRVVFHLRTKKPRSPSQGEQRLPAQPGPVLLNQAKRSEQDVSQ
jgi:hypothetical protein